MTPRTIVRSLVAAGLLAANPASAQSLPFGIPAPYDGVYFDPSQPGIGLWLDNGPDGTTFGALMYYADDGRPTFATFASPLLHSGSLNASIARDRQVRGPLYESVDGQCLGCPYRAPVSTPINAGTFAGGFTVVIEHRTTSTRFQAAAGEPHSWFDMKAMPFGRTDMGLFEGTWWLALEDGRQRLQAVVRIVPVTGLRFHRATGHFYDPTGLDENDLVHEVECIASCGDFEAWRGATRVLVGADSSSRGDEAGFGRWADTPSGLARLDVIRVRTVPLAGREPVRRRNDVHRTRHRRRVRIRTVRQRR
jgi:hypothetical protein